MYKLCAFFFVSHASKQWSRDAQGRKEKMGQAARRALASEHVVRPNIIEQHLFEFILNYLRLN